MPWGSQSQACPKHHQLPFRNQGAGPAHCKQPKAALSASVAQLSPTHVGVPSDNVVGPRAHVKHRLALVTEQEGLGRHEPSNDYKELAIWGPLGIMDGAILQQQKGGDNVSSCVQGLKPNRPPQALTACGVKPDMQSLAHNADTAILQHSYIGASVSSLIHFEAKQPATTGQFWKRYCCRSRVVVSADVAPQCKPCHAQSGTADIGILAATGQAIDSSLKQSLKQLCCKARQAALMCHYGCACAAPMEAN